MNQIKRIKRLINSMSKYTKYLSKWKRMPLWSRVYHFKEYGYLRDQTYQIFDLEFYLPKTYLEKAVHSLIPIQLQLNNKKRLKKNKLPLSNQ